jgi:hypothetical protein
MSENLTYRIFEKDDIGGILRLWAEESGWGAITEEQFNKWYLHTPYGECLIVLAIDEDKNIVGQQVFMPSTIFVSGNNLNAFRVLAPILSKKIRANIRKKNHPFFEMHQAGLKEAIERKYSVIYGFPAHAWTPVLRLFPKAGLPKMEIAEFDCRSFSYQSVLPKTEKIKHLKISPIDRFEENFDELWNNAIANFPIECGVIRNSEWLNWKNGGRWSFAAHNSENKLVGYLSIDKKTSLLADVLAETPEILEQMFETFCSFTAQNKQFGIQEFKVMKTNFMSPIIEKFGFSKVDFKFAFGCYSIDTNIPTEAIQPQNWYMMPND